jgi:hypothetical protein
MLHPANLPIIMHFVLELMAINAFVRLPGIQLHEKHPTREAVLICYSYAGTLFTLNLICAMYVWLDGISTFGPIGTALAWSLSSYHAFPMFRAWDRMQRKQAAGSGYKSEFDIAGGPQQHFRGHLIMFFSLATAGIYGVLQAL